MKNVRKLEKRIRTEARNATKQALSAVIEQEKQKAKKHAKRKFTGLAIHCVLGAALFCVGYIAGAVRR